MKYITHLTLFIFVSFISSNSFGNEKISIKINGNSKNINCSVGAVNIQMDYSKIDIYQCKLDGLDIIVKHDPEYGSWSGYSFNDTGISPIKINLVKSGDENLFLENEQSKVSQSKSIKDKYAEFLDLKNSNDELQYNKDVTIPKDLRAKIDIAKGLLSSKMLKIENTFYKHKKVEVITEAGQKLSCSRGENKNGYRYMCMMYHCDPIFVNGEEYQVSFRNKGISPSTSAPYLMLGNKSKLGPDLKIKNIKMDNKDYYNGKSEVDSDSIQRESFIPESLKSSEETYIKLTDPLSKAVRENEMESCLSSTLDQNERVIHSGLNEYSKKLDEVKLVQVIKLTNGILSKEVLSSENITDEMCKVDGDVWLSDKNTLNEKRIKALVGMSPKSNAISENQLDEVFKFAMDQKDIPYDYVLEGCYARAHVLCDRIENELEIDTEKIWAYGKVAPPNRKDKPWNFHVATKVNVEKNGKILSYVIDPSVSKKPLQESEWLDLIKVNKTTQTMKVSWPPAVYTGEIKNIKVSYSDNEVYNMAETKENLTQERIDRDYLNANTTNSKYMGVLNDL